MANVFYNYGKSVLASDGTSWNSSAVFKVLLVDSSSTYSPDADDRYVADATSGGMVECNGTGYTSGFAGDRFTTGSRTVNTDTTNDWSWLDCGDPNWTGLGPGFTVKAMIVYHHITSDALSTMIAYIDQPGGGGAGQFPFITNGGDLTLTINTSSGLLTLS